MIFAYVTLDLSRKMKKSYPVKIRIVETGVPYKLVSVNIYHNEKELEFTSEIARRMVRLEEEIDFCNKNKFKLSDSIL